MIRLIDKENQTTVSILPEYGAMLHEFIVVTNDIPHNLIENYKDRETLEREFSISYKSAKLSPFVCRISEAKYSHKGNSYEFSQKYNDGSAIHGLLYNKPFEVAEQFVNEQNASLSLKYHYKAEDPGYPFEYTCIISYKLLPQNVLQVITTIENLHGEAIPVSDGWHPYFSMGGKVNDWRLSFPSSRKLEYNEKLIPTGNYETDSRFIEGMQIGNEKIDHCFLLENASTDDPACTLYNPNNKLRLTVFADWGYPYLQIFTAVNRESIAIENLSGAPDCFNNSMGVLMIAPKNSETFKLHYKVGQE